MQGSVVPSSDDAPAAAGDMLLTMHTQSQLENWTMTGRCDGYVLSDLDLSSFLVLVRPGSGQHNARGKRSCRVPVAI